MTTAAGRFAYLPAKGGRQHLRALLAMLSRLETSGEWQIDRALTRGAELLKRRGAVIAVSDFYDAYRDHRPGSSSHRSLRTRRGAPAGLVA